MAYNMVLCYAKHGPDMTLIRSDSKNMATFTLFHFFLSCFTTPYQNNKMFNPDRSLSHNYE